MRAILLSVLLPPSVYSLTVPRNTQDCQSFAQNAPSIENMTLINSTLNTASENTTSFCKVLGQVAYGINDTLNFQVWLPDAELYNGRFMAVGNVGMAGTIDTNAMSLQLNSGFAVAGGDAGHLASQNSNGIGAPNTYLPYLHDPDQVKAWIHNGISLFTSPAKTLTASYYGVPAKYNYYDACSTGGAQGFALAQFHPELFDGIIAGSPGNWYAHLALSFLWNAAKTKNESFIPQEKLELIRGRVVEACDENDGVRDGLIENPLRCEFDIDYLACEEGVANTSACLTAEQVEAVRAIYAGPGSTLDHEFIYPGFSFGSESEWLMQEGELADFFSIPILQNLVKGDLEYDASTFDFGRDVREVDEKAGRFIDEISPDLSAYRGKGGKMIVTQGWTDPYNTALWPIIHKRDIENFFGGDISDFFNLFMIPGGGHCGVATSYPGIPSTYHTVEKLVKWVEQGEKPEGVVSTNPPDGSDRSRLLCPWPKTARYMDGDIDNWESYKCEID